MKKTRVLWITVLILSLVISMLGPQGMVLAEAKGQPDLVQDSQELPMVADGSIGVVSKGPVTVGDEITLYLKMEDDMKLSSIHVAYAYPTAEDKTEQFSLYYNSETKRYEGTMTIEERFESGTWKLLYVSATSEDGVFNCIYNIMVQKESMSMDMSGGDFEVYGTNADITRPVIYEKTLMVTPERAVPGESVEVSVEITDDNVGISSARICYESPETKTITFVHLDRQGDSNLYSAQIPVTADYERGQWVVTDIAAYDEHYNRTCILNGMVGSIDSKDLNQGNFWVDDREDAQILEAIDPLEGVTIYRSSDSIANVSIDGDVYIGPEADMVNEASLTVTPKEPVPGDTVEVSVEITDDKSGIFEAEIWYVSPVTDDITIVDLEYQPERNLYTAEIPITTDTERGTWVVRNFKVYDNHSNGGYIYNTEAGYSSSEKHNYNEGNYTVGDVEEAPILETIEPLDQVTIYRKSQKIEDAAIEGDVYIGPEAVVTLSNVTVSGNIYVLGGLRFQSSSTQGIHGRNFSTGYGSSFSNGTVYWSGTCSISTMSASSTPVRQVPYRIDLAESRDGLLEIKGVTADVAEFYINGEPVNMAYHGKFYKKDLNIGDAETVELRWETVFGNTIVEQVPVDAWIQAEDGIYHHRPELTVTNQEFLVNESADLMAGVSATDAEDGNLTDRVIIVDDGGFDISQRGTYTIIYSVTDNQGAEVRATATVTVKEPKIFSVSLDQNQILWTCDMDSSVTLTPTIETQDNPEYQLRWESSNPEVATVDEEGHVTILGEGQSEITLYVDGADPVTCQIEAKHKGEPVVYPADQVATFEQDGWKTVYCSTCLIPLEQISIPALDRVELSYTKTPYNMGYQVPDVTVYDRLGNIVSDHNYNVDIYTENGDSPCDAGKYQLEVNFFGAYEGSKQFEYEITKIKLTDVYLSTEEYVYDGKSKTPRITAYSNNIPAADYVKKSTRNLKITYSSGRKKVGTYTVKVKGIKNFTGTITKTFTIRPKGTIIDTLSADSGRKKTITVQWKKQTKEVDGYQLRYSRYSSMKKSKILTITDNKTTKKAVTGLKSGKKYYFQIRTYKDVKGKRYYSDDWGYPPISLKPM